MLVLRVPPALWNGVVREKELFRPAQTVHPGLMDGHRAGPPIRTGTDKSLHYHKQPGDSPRKTF